MIYVTSNTYSICLQHDFPASAQHVLLRLSIILKLMIIFLYYRHLATVFIHYRSVYLISNDLNSIKLVLSLFESCLMVNEIRILSLVVGIIVKGFF